MAALMGSTRIVLTGPECSLMALCDGTVTYRLVHLTFGPGEKLSLDLGVFTPATGGPFPAIISPAGSPPGAPLRVGVADDGDFTYENVVDAAAV